MAEVEDEIRDAGAEIIWVLERGPGLEPGTAELSDEVMEELGSEAGWCVGDAETEPTPETFDQSPLAFYVGFDMIVPRSSMRVEWVSTHGFVEGNENLDGQAVVDAVLAVTER